MKRMLINATHAEEVRVAIVDGQRLHDLDIENKSRQQKKSNIYKARITRIEPSLEAAFVDYGAERHGFLPFKEIAREYLDDAAFSDGGRPNVKAGIREGKEIIVQVEKEERGNKGAALTTFISLAGRFLVLMPNNPRAGGVSRRIEGDDRAQLRAAMNEITVPENMGTIVRTAGIGRTPEELQWDLDYQVGIWQAIQEAAKGKSAPFLIYQESNVIVRALRDNFRNDIGEILVDEPDVFGQASDFVQQYMPHHARRVKQYEDPIPLFSRFQIESQIESAFQREVQLPSGGAIVIDHTEALISIDINSARATKGSDIEETATNTNLEACDEIARQLRLRDIGGLIVIDFIDMMASKNQRRIESRLKEVMKIDRARVQIGRISRFGLLELSRQRLRPSLGESSQIVCPRCSGHGTIRGIESLSLSILRLIEEEAMKDNTGRVLAQTPVDVASYLVNEKRENIAEIESRTGVQLLIVPSMGLETPHFQLERIRTSDVEHDSHGRASYELSINFDEPYVPTKRTEEKTSVETPAVMRVVPDKPAPKPAAKVEETPARRPAQSAGVVSKIIGAFSTLFHAEPRVEPVSEENEPRKAREPRNDRSKSGDQKRNENQQKDRSRNSRRNKSERTEEDKDNAESPANKQEKKSRNSRKRKKPSDQDKDNNQAQSADVAESANGNTAKDETAESDENRPRKKSRNRRSSRNRRNRDRDGNRESKEGTEVDGNVAVESDGNSDSATAKDGNSEERSQRQGSNYNRSRRQGQRDEPANDEGKAETAAPKPAEDAQLKDGGNDANGDSRGRRVSSRQPSQLKSTVRSLANRNDDEKAEQPQTEAPKTEAPKADAPKADARKADAPKADTPKADAPKADAPKAQAPKTDAPKSKPRVRANSSDAGAPPEKKSGPADQPAQSDRTSSPSATVADSPRPAPKPVPQAPAPEPAPAATNKPETRIIDTPQPTRGWGSPKPEDIKSDDPA